MGFNTIGDEVGFCSWPPNLGSITRALRHCGRILATKHGRALHSQLIKHGICGTVFIANNLIAMYSDLGFYGDAQRLFDEMPKRNVVSWTAAILAHTRAGNPAEALRVFNQMLDHRLEEPNNFTFSAALNACAMAGNLNLGKWIHERVLRARLQADTVLMNAVLDMYVKCGSLTEAQKVFDGISPLSSTSWNTMIAGYFRGGNMIEAENLFSQIPEPDDVTFNTMIAGFTQAESPKALHYVRIMHESGIRFDHFTFPCSLKTCSSLGFEKMGTQIHSHIIKCGFELDRFTGPALLDMYARCGRMNDATKIFDEQSKPKRVISDRLPLLNSMVSGFAINRYDRHALDLLSKIHSAGIGLDIYTLSSALKVCINLQNLRIGRQVHCLVLTSGYHLDHIVGSALVDLYAKCGNLENGLRLFVGLPCKDVVTWAGLITGCVQQGWNQLVFSLFRDMMSLTVEVDHFVISSVLKACSVLAWFEGGKQVHAYSIKGGFAFESVTVTSLIDMYSKCGEIEDGIRVFQTATEKDTVCWTGMVVGCGYNGRAMEAMRLFDEMLKCTVKPNKITFLGALSACRHAGLVEEACQIFNAMVSVHGLMPCLEHYCCMVDILSRAGRYEEVKQLISVMPYEPDETMRNSLVGACVIHQNDDIGKLPLVGQLPVSHFDASGYVTLSNAYASVGMWDVSAKFREVIQRVNMKEVGRSWLDVRN